ncbi:MAG: glycosyltransferase family 9 protein [Candidatus Omnitrophica bacterium]|nr:glycosyltransferase family 9 protein [Candidatus Omnitrophota bacterium]
MKKFIFINPFGIGDVLFTTPLVRAVKKRYPDSFICYWCNERVSPVLEANRNIDKIYALSRGDLKKIFKRSFFEGTNKGLSLFFALKKGHFDISLDFSLDHRYSLISKFLGIRERLGYDYKGRGRFLTKKIEISGYNHKHIVDYYLDLLGLLGIEGDDKKLDLSLKEGERDKAREYLKNSGIDFKKPLVGIAPGAGESWGKDAGMKRWPVDKFRRLAKEIAGTLDSEVIILGSTSERDLAGEIIRDMPGKSLDLTGKTTLTELIAVIDSLDLLITNDGGPLHIGVALGKKTVSFFGPVDPLVYGPYPPDEESHAVMRSSLDCSPCYRNFRLVKCDRDKECLEKIKVEEALRAANKLLSERQGNKCR